MTTEVFGEVPTEPVSPARSDLLEKWLEVLSGEDAMPPLQAPSEVQDLLTRLFQEREVSEKERQRLAEVFSLQYFYRGREIACLRSAKGLIVLAVGSQEVGLLFSQFSSEQLRNVTIECPG